MAVEAMELVETARARVCAAHPFLALALNRLRPEPCGEIESAATDGERFLFHPEWARRAFLSQARALDAALFHSLAHCLLGHVFQRAGGAPAWAIALARDFQAARLAADCAPELASAWRDARVQELSRRFSAAMDVDALARALSEDGYAQENRAALGDALALDAHDLWSRAKAPQVMTGGGEGAAQIWRRLGGAIRGGSGGRDAGREAGAKRERMRLGEARRADFARALRRYAGLREDPRDDPDSLQPAWYHYGAAQLGCPLIEPVEYREARGLDALAIVIDTSGSCARGLTRRFLELTRDILFEKNLFFRRFNLRILQCDAQVQREDHITSRAAFERYIDELEVVGGGGTDFRPAIARIDELVASGELRGLRGALYFSDGRGVFPSKPTDYELCFVFLKHRFDDIDVPAWVRRIVIDAPAPRGGEYYEY